MQQTGGGLGGGAGAGPGLASSAAFRVLAVLLIAATFVQIGLVWRHQRMGDDGLRRAPGAPDASLRRQRELLLRRLQQREDVGSGGSRVVTDGEGDGGSDDPLPGQQQAVIDDIDLSSLLSLAGIDPTDESVRTRLPSPPEISSMYGPAPVILGEESCPAFRSAVPPSRRHVGPAGLLNTGTNMLATLLRRNCYVAERPGAYEDRWKSGMIFQVPWGKHNPPSFRLRNVAKQGGKGVVQTDVLPVVVVRDPIGWMASMCRHPYAVRMGGNCRAGELVGTKEPVTVAYKEENVTAYESLVDLWRVWYEEWLVVPFPALYVRFEDLLFRPERVVDAVCDCAGGRRREKFYIKGESAKGEVGPHAGGSGYLESVVKYGNATRRGDTLAMEEDREHVRSGRYVSLLAKFRYSVDGI